VSKKRRSYACWKCGGAMRKKGTFCKRCKKRGPQAVKAATAMLTKSLGRAPRPVPVPVVKAAAPRCPNPACGAKASLTANCCVRCGTPLGMTGQVRAEKAARRTQLQIVHSAAWWEAQAARQHDPEAREMCRAQARKAAGAQGQPASAASLIVKASGARTVREAWLRESDPHMREVLRNALYNQEGGRPA
jgi:predicted amidophosphoribosyltransferase